MRRILGLAVGGMVLATAVGLAAPSKKDLVIYRDPDKYCAFPGLRYDGNQRLWVSFGWNTTRSHYGALAGGKSGHYVMFSPDLGEHWIRNDQEGYQEPPPELSSLRLSDGTLVRAGPRGWEGIKPEEVKDYQARGIEVRKVKASGRYVVCYRAVVRVSHDGGKTWKSRTLTFDKVALMLGGPAPAIVLPDDTILVPMYGRASRNQTGGNVWCMRSEDGGETWQLLPVAYDGSHPFTEWGMVSTGGQRVVGLMRCEGGGKYNCPPHDIGFLYQVVSEDGGKTWGKPVKTPLWGYPPTLIRLRDGALLATYGYRRPPYGVRACFSYDQGKTWDWQHEVILRADALPHGPGKQGSLGDLGYPRSVELKDGRIFTVYYITLGDGVTHIAASLWTRDYTGPADLARGQAAVPAPDPSLPPRHIIGEVGSLSLMAGVTQSFIPTEPQVAAVAIRVAKASSQYEHTHGLFVVLRQRTADGNWWGPWIAQSETLKPDQVKIGGWNLFRFNPPVKVKPGELYILTVYNRDYAPYPVGLKAGLKGDHRWVLNVGGDDYPNGGIGGNDFRDLGFCVYSQVPDKLPEDPK